MLKFWLQVGLRSDPIWHFMTQLPTMSTLVDFLNFVKISIFKGIQKTTHILVVVEARDLKFWLQVCLRSDPIWHFMTQLPKMSCLADFFNFVKISILESCQAIQPGCNEGMWVMLVTF